MKLSINPAVAVDQAFGCVTGPANGAYGYVAKYDPAGTRLWLKQFDGTLMDIAVDPAGNSYIAAGRGNLMKPANVIKFGTDGTKLFDVGFGTAPASSANAVALDSAGNIYVAGEAYESLDGEPYVAFGDAYAMKLDNNGTRIWTRMFGTNGAEQVSGIGVNASGDAFMCGSGPALPAADAGGLGGIFTAKFSGDAGATQWLVQFAGGNTGCDSALPVGVGEVIIGGTGPSSLSGGTSGGGHAFVIRLDAAGNRRWINQNKNATGQSQNSNFGNMAATATHVFEAFSTGYNDGYPSTTTNSNGFLRRIDINDGGLD